MIFSVPALLALAGVAVLSLFPDGHLLTGAQMGPDRATLWFLLLCSLIAQVPALHARLRASRDASTWATLCVFFILFHLADRAGPRDGWSLTFPFAPDDPAAISYATRIVVVGALLSISLWLRRGGPEKSIIVALGLIGALGLGMFYFLGHYFPIGADKIINPQPMATLLVQVVAYGALALCCRAATEVELFRGFMLRALPVALLLVVLRHQLSPIPVPPPSPED
ncbi:hypothetical protein IAD21_04173 [Abditibacteriota bacterium]|nr:hypothetical protein IAD21_04173 [Abditibacteriota bacterium]